MGEGRKQARRAGHARVCPPSALAPPLAGIIGYCGLIMRSTCEYYVVINYAARELRGAGSSASSDGDLYIIRIMREEGEWERDGSRRGVEAARSVIGPASVGDWPGPRGSGQTGQVRAAAAGMTARAPLGVTASDPGARAAPPASSGRACAALPQPHAPPRGAGFN